ncbi:hypothetical protein TNCV_4432081 [Trichonephila clavipes]|nr:hypothetical protein TNCV_4432081 [Trichonephila clavipes]
MKLSKATNHQLPFSPKIGKQIQDMFYDLEVSSFVLRVSYTDAISKCIAKFFRTVDHGISNSRDSDRPLPEEKMERTGDSFNHSSSDFFHSFSSNRFPSSPGQHIQSRQIS